MGEGKLLNPKLIELEGMAMAGKVRRVTVVECDDFPVGGWKKIVAELDDGSIYETGCMEPEAAKRNFMVLALYTRRWGKLINTGDEA